MSPLQLRRNRQYRWSDCRPTVGATNPRFTPKFHQVVTWQQEKLHGGGLEQASCKTHYSGIPLMDEPEQLRSPPERPLSPKQLAAGRLAEFHADLTALSPHVIATPVIVGINVLVFAIMALNGISPISPTVEELLHIGANSGIKTTNGEWWRLLTANYIHIGFMHLAFNMWALWSAGCLVERLVGTLGFIILYTFSGIAGSVASCFWDPWMVSAGASGAIFGVWGALLGFLLLRRDSVPFEALAQLRNSGLAFVGYNLVLGFFIPHIDMAAHLGGLVAGFLGGLALSRPLHKEALVKRPIRNLVVGGIGLVLVAGFVLVAPPVAADLQAEFIKFGESEEKLLKIHDDLSRQLQTSSISLAGMADRIESEILPQWRAAGAPILSMTRVRPEQKKLVEAFCRYIKCRQEAWEALVLAGRKDDRSKAEVFNKKWAETQRIVDEIKAIAKQRQ
jgi:membrane associated rhomboid family serine protease